MPKAVKSSSLPSSTTEPVAPLVEETAIVDEPAADSEVLTVPIPASRPRFEELHDASHQVRLLREALQSDKVRAGFLLGAGCPLGIYDANDEKSILHIPDVAGLTKNVRLALENLDGVDFVTIKLLPLWDKISDACKDDTIASPNVEHILSELRTLCGRRGRSDIDGMSKDELLLLDATICDVIANEVGKSLPTHRCSYHRFASWVGGLQRVAPVELFTPNYDLLLEEAFEQQRIPHFDGFVGAREPFFDLASIEQDLIPSRWTRLWKLHGSINWQKRDDGCVFRVAGKAAAGKAMIYPSHLKYDQSRRLPYLAMLDRLRAFFRTGGHSLGYGPPVLVISGYSFFDEHLNEVLLDGLRGNRSAQCFVLSYTDLLNSKAVIDHAIKQPNLSVIAFDGAVVGTRVGTYRKSLTKPIFPDPWLNSERVEAVPTVESPFHIRCRLGDFHYFALFLEQLCGGTSNADPQ